MMISKILAWTQAGLLAATLAYGATTAQPRTALEERIDEVEAQDPSLATAPDRDGNYTVGDCPVVGNLNSGLYHVPGQAKYAEMLKINKCAIERKCEDNRVCFDTEAEARAGKKIFVTKNRQVVINPTSHKPVTRFVKFTKSGS